MEYRLDLLQFFQFVDVSRSQKHLDFQFVNIEFIGSITLGDMYAFLTYCQNTLHSSPSTRTRKIISIRQFWKYLKTKVHLIDNNIAEELETPKHPKRIVRCLTLEESVRLLIESSSSSVRDNCIITIFLNCALRLSELESLNVDQVNSDMLSIIGKENKERKIFITPAVKQSLTKWLPIRNSMTVNTNVLFTSRNGGRLQQEPYRM